MQTIFVLAAGNEQGGAASHLVTLAEQTHEQASTQIRFHFVCVGAGPLQLRLEASTAECTVIPSSLFASVKTLKHLLHNEKSILLHAHGPRANLIAYLACRAERIPWTSTVHSNPNLDFLASRWKTAVLTKVNLFCLRHAVGVFVVNPAFAEFIPNETIIYVPNGLRLQPLKESKLVYEQRLRERLHLPESTRLVGVAARMDPVKDLSTLIRAVAGIANENIHLAIAGDGSEWNKLHALVKEMQVEKRVHFLGYIDWVDEFYAGLSAHVLASRSEGLPFCVLEAGFYGVPNVGTDIPGLTHIIDHETTGLLVPVGDYAKLGAAIIRVLGMPRFTEKLVEEFRKEVLPRFVPQRMVDAYSRGYALFISPKTPAELRLHLQG